MAHLTCQGHARQDIAAILIDYRAEGIENILALGGDPPTDADEPMTSDYRHASELVDDIADVRRLLDRRRCASRAASALARP